MWCGGWWGGRQKVWHWRGPAKGVADPLALVDINQNKGKRDWSSVASAKCQSLPIAVCVKDLELDPT